MEKAYGASVYISYARADEKRLNIVTQLYEAYQPTWVNLKVDEKVVQPRESFKDFIEELGKADCIIVLLSDAYIQSFYCMLELTRIIEKGNTKERVFPIFLDEFRLDDKNRLLKSKWAESLKKRQQLYDKVECSEEYGSETESQAIVDKCGDIYDLFAFDVAYKQDNLSKDCFNKTIQWSKERYLHICKNNPIFEVAIKHLSLASTSVKNALKEQIKDKSISGADENIIAWLVQNHPTELLKIIAKAQSDETKNDNISRNSRN